MNYKHILSLVLALLMVLSLAACSSKAPVPTDPAQPGASNTPLVGLILFPYR